MTLTSLGLPRFNGELGLYECEITEYHGFGGPSETYNIYASTPEALQQKKVEFIKGNLEEAQIGLTTFK